MALEAFEKHNASEISESVKNLHEGVQMTKSALLKVFAKHGIVSISPIGEKFDPNLHDAVYEVPHDQVKSMFI